MQTIRRNVVGVVYHLIWRFVDRRWYFAGDGERDVYLGMLGRALGQSDWRCLAYALMSNHIHLALLAGSTQLASWSRRVHSPFAAWLNERHDRLGPVFAHSPKDYAIAPAKEAALLAYLHNNPVRAGVVEKAHESAWTSHRAYAGIDVDPPWLHVDEGLARIAMTQATFSAWVDNEPGDPGAVAVDRAALALRHRGGLRVATPSKEAMPLVARPFAHVRVDPRRVVELGAEISGISALVVCSRRRVSDALVAKRAIVHAGRAMGLSDSDLAAALGLSQQGTSKMASRSLSDGERRLSDTIRERACFEASGESGDRPHHLQ